MLLAVSAMIQPLYSQTGQTSWERYISGRLTDASGKEIISVTTPVKPPAGYKAPVASIPKSAVILGSVPAFSWSFGCSATAAAMAGGFYDNNGYSDVYTGPTNGGVMPMNNSSWGTVTINGEIRDLCPLSATMLNLDGRTTNGHVDDFWVQYGSENPDPYITNGWTPHTNEDCLGDFMGTNQSAYGNSDGSTTFFFYSDGSPIYDYSGSEPGAKDGCHGMRQFFESRGYTVVQNYTQLIYGENGNTLGFTFEQYMNEIDNGRPVLIQVSGHTMLGFGYEEASQTVYLHDTWDYSDHSMIWGGEYAGMDQWGVSVLELFALNAPPIANFSGTPTQLLTGGSVDFIDLSSGNPSSWQWVFEGGTPATSSLQNPTVSYNSAGVYGVSLTVTNANGNDTEVKNSYILVEEPDYCDVSASCDEFIQDFTFNTIANTSGCGTNGYTDYTNLSTTVVAGENYSISATTGIWYTGDQCGAWADWNQDLDFDDEGEYYAMIGYPFSGTITPPADAMNGPTRLRVRILYTGDIVPCGTLEYGETEDYTVIVDNPSALKTIQLTLFLEGLMNESGGVMNKAQDDSGFHFPGSVADEVKVSLANAAAPYAIVFEADDVPLNQNGQLSLQVPSAFSGNYYIVINHRNSIESWSAVPLPFNTGSIIYNFSDASSKTFGGNVIFKGSRYCLYGGDVNQDGTLDTGDMTPVDNDASDYVSGYTETDVNGDGIVDTSDMTVVDNNAGAYVGTVKP